jgi:hypothetical protein
VDERPSKTGAIVSHLKKKAMQDQGNESLGAFVGLPWKLSVNYTLVQQLDVRMPCTTGPTMCWIILQVIR